MKHAIVVWNGGEGALLCNGDECKMIVAYGFEHEDKKHYCKKCKVKKVKDGS